MKQRFFLVSQEEHSAYTGEDTMVLLYRRTPKNEVECKITHVGPLMVLGATNPTWNSLWAEFDIEYERCKRQHSEGSLARAWKFYKCLAQVRADLQRRGLTRLLEKVMEYVQEVPDRPVHRRAPRVVSKPRVQSSPRPSRGGVRGPYREERGRWVRS